MYNNIKNILIGVSGGIAAYKIPFLVRILKKAGYEVKVVITKSAESLVGLDTLRTLTGYPVYRDVADEYDMGHIRLEEWADLFIVAPATANSIAKMAHGIADNLLTTLFLSITAPILVVPAMNTNMWKNRATQNNITLILSRGIKVLPVGKGELACGVVGAGRMIEPEDIALYVNTASIQPLLKGKKVLIASGPTEEAIDPVRVITNRSTGKMGNALARVALMMGAEVTMVSGPAETVPPAGIDLVSVKTALEMKRAVDSYFESSDITIMAAAISDFRVAQQSDEKIAREGRESMEITLVSNPDIAASLGEKKESNQVLVTFSLEKSGGIERAKEKMKRKKADITVYNRVEDALGKDDTSMVILSKEGDEKPIREVDKTTSAVALLEYIAQRTEAV